MERFGKLTVSHVLESVSKRYPDKVAVMFEDENVTFQELKNYAVTIGKKLMQLGVKKNDKVAVLLPNCLEYLYIYFALFEIGAWIVPISTRYEPEEVGRILSDSDVETIIYQDKVGIFDYNEVLFEKIVDYIPKIDNYIVLGSDKPVGTIDFSTLLKHDKSNDDISFEEIEPDDVAILGYTSGTTGHPKGVMITHGHLVETSYYGGEVFEMDEEAGFSIAPLYAAQGFNSVLIYVVSGITMKWISNFNPNDILTHITRNDISLVHTQPTMWSLMLSMPYYQHVIFKNLKKVVVSGSLCIPHLAQKIEESTRCTLLNSYGIIEATGIVTSTRLDDPEDVRINTVGRPIGNFELKIVDDKRNEVQKGEIGELAIKGYLMKGYYKNVEKTQEIIDDEGWLYTGDLATYYKDGINICIVGRCKDMVIRGGFNVYPVDIEECLMGFDKIEDIAVVGEDDEFLGEALVAFVIPKPGNQILEGDIKRYCRGKIANYKIPDRVIFVSQFPILESGKIQKNILRKWAIDSVPSEGRFLMNNVLIEGVAKK